MKNSLPNLRIRQWCLPSLLLSHTVVKVLSQKDKKKNNTNIELGEVNLSFSQLTWLLSKVLLRVLARVSWQVAEPFRESVRWKLFPWSYVDVISISIHMVSWVGSVAFQRCNVWHCNTAQKQKHKNPTIFYKAQHQRNFQKCGTILIYFICFWK